MTQFPVGTRVQIKGSHHQGVVTGKSFNDENTLVKFPGGDSAALPEAMLEKISPSYEVLAGDIWRLLNGWEYAGRSNNFEGGVGLIPLDTANGQRYVPPGEALEYLHITSAKLVRRRGHAGNGETLHDYVYNAD